MRSNKVSFFFVFILFVSSTLCAQPQVILDYVYDSSVQVYTPDSILQTLSGCGGFNNPQFGMADLNNDGLQDLVVFENGHGVRTFINEGSPGNPKYIYVPRYELNFPPISDYMVLADYNCDNIADLFEQGEYGFAVYRGYYNWKNELCFTFYKNLFYSNDTYANGTANAFNNPGDIPAIVDVDNDGDLDFISYNIIGGYMNFYKNERVEENLPCDSIVIKLVDRCWGKVYQGYYRGHILQYECDNNGLNKETQDTTTANKKTHSGNTPCLFDYDDDGDYDYLDGSISWNEMTFLLNGRVENGWPVDTMVTQDTMWQSNGTQIPGDTNGTQIEIPIWPAAFNVDIDQDGKKDLLIAPNAANTSENYKCIWFYKNNTTPGHPSWTFQSDTFLIDQTIDLGTAAYPTFFDYNKDGKPDLFIGSDGYYQSDGTLRSRISYYMNITDTPGHPKFRLMAKDFLGLSIDQFQGIAPAMGDIDGDGKTDLILGHADGTITYFKNLAPSDDVQPQWQLTQAQLTDAGGNIIGADGDGGGHSAPIIYDIDTDGKADLLIGDMYGNIRYYKNTGTTPGVISLQFMSDTLGGAKADPNQVIGNYATPYIGPLDNTGTPYLLMGSNSGDMYRYSGFQGNTTTDFNLVDTQYCYIDSTDQLYNHPSTYFGIYGGFRSAPAVADIAGDGTLVMVIGDIFGGVKFYTKGIAPSSVANVNATNYDVHLYPNPAKEMINIIWNGISSMAETRISIYNIEGQQAQQITVPKSQHSAQLNVSSLAPGMYICAVSINGQVSYNKFTVLK